MSFFQSILFGKKTPPTPKTWHVCKTHGKVSVMRFGENGTPFCMRCTGEFLSKKFPVELVNE